MKTQIEKRLRSCKENDEVFFSSSALFLSKKRSFFRNAANGLGRRNFFAPVLQFEEKCRYFAQKSEYVNERSHRNRVVVGPGAQARIMSLFSKFEDAENIQIGNRYEGSPLVG